MKTRSQQRIRTRTTSFQHDLRALANLSEASADEIENPRSYRYERLATVVVRNGFFRSSGGVCPSFSIQPTPSTQNRLYSMSLLEHESTASLSAVYDSVREDALVATLRRESQRILGPHGTRPGSWTRLSYVLSLEACDGFVNFTRIPLDFHPSRHNFYFTNRQAHRTGEQILLQPGELVGPGEMVPVVPVQHAVPVAPGVESVQVVALSGEVVIDLPTHGQHRIYLDFTELPFDLYEIRQVVGGVAQKGKAVLYTQSDPMPFAFVDLFFSRPEPEDGGVYPVDLETGEVEPVVYELVFEERSVTWIYLVVPSSPWCWEELRIRSDDPGITFGDPELVELASGRPAYQFLSSRPLPLFDQSPFRFELWGESSAVSTPQRLVRRLPVASPSAVLPYGEVGGAAARIFVNL